MADGGDIKISTSVDSTGVTTGIAKLGGLVKAALSAAGIALTLKEVFDIGKYIVDVGSNFEAAMSKVSAISGATGKDLEALTEKAKEMGATTKFTATESAEALTYMGMAGWNASEMLDGLEGIMYLAAASGEDLGRTSDIVTDALTAFGLKASDSAHFADVLAVASSRSNTNVGMMGETFKYVAPIAGAMGYTIEDMAVSIGLMANSGIKAEQAGTSLRMMITRLADPPAEAKKALDALGVSMTDESGNMKSFDTVVGELREGFKGLSEAEKAQAASSIAGVHSMSGLLALVNASDEDFNSLKVAINNADGAAKEMAVTMEDNLKGDITILKSGIEGLGIQIYESMQEPLRKAAKEGQEAVSRISKAFAAGGFKAAFQEAGKIIKDWVSEFAKAHPEIGKVITAVQSVISALMSFIQNVAVPVVEFLGKVITFLAPIAPVIAATVAAVYLCINAMTIMTSVLAAVKTGITATQAALTTLAANPMTLAVIACATVAAGLILLKKHLDIDEEAEAHKKNIEELISKGDELTESMKSRQEAYELLKTSSAETAAAAISEADRVRELKDELVVLADENGHVAEKDRERASVILNELSTATGVEISMNDGVIESYGEVISSIEEYISTKRTEAIVEAETARYKEAVANQIKAAKDVYETQNNLSKLRTEYARQEAEVEKQYQEALQGGVAQMNAALKAKEDLKNSDLAKEIEEESAAIAEQQQLLGTYQADIRNYNDLMAAVATGDQQAIEKAITAVTTGLKHAGEVNKEELEKQVTDCAAFEAAIRAEVEKGTPGYTQAMLDQASKATQAAIEELNAANDGYTSAGTANMDSYTAGVQSATPEVVNASKTASSQAVEAATIEAENANAAGEILINEEAAAIVANKAKVTSTAQAAQKEVNLTLQNTVNGKVSGEKLTKEEADALYANRYKVTGAAGDVAKGANQAASDAINGKPTGEKFTSGMSTGLTDGKTTVGTAAAGLAKVTVAESAGDGISVGKVFGQGMSSGMFLASPGVAASGRSLGNDAVNGAKGVSGNAAGSYFSQGFANGIRSGGYLVTSAGSYIGKLALAAAKKAINSSSPSKAAAEIGGYFTEGFAVGIEDEAALVANAAEKVSEAALNNLEYETLADQMKDAVTMNKQDLTGNLVTNVVHKIELAANSEFMDMFENLKENLLDGIRNMKVAVTANTNLQVDGKTLAEVSTPFTDTLLGSMEERRLRGAIA
ncbi:MAG: phage tail tape measure protein [Lachnospiraceae bacterium]|jgi:TP901 family phage tail tape measure protein|nr:phage tail tape measure protein [Lachnospiraceae bacterium]